MVDFEEVMTCEWFTGKSPFRMTFELKNPKVCVITGDNATGKSLLRKLIYNEYLDRKVELMHLSQAARTRSGMHRVFLYGSEEDQSTGHNTTKTMLDAIKTSKSRDKPHSLLFDEPEIGCSEELAAGLGFRLAGELPNLTNLECCYIISHSRAFLKEISSRGPSHVHLMKDEHDYITLKDWLTRPVKPVHELEKVVERGKLGWRFVQGKINEGRR